MNSIFKLSGKTLIIILLLGVLVLLLTLFSLYNSSQPTQTPPPSSIPRINPNDFPAPSYTPSLSLNTSPKKSVYSDLDLERDFQRIKNRQPLSQADSKARNSLISSLNNQSGYLTENPNYKIEYVKEPNLFMIEILSTDTALAEDASINWLKSKGISDEGICNLPVLIYLNYQIAEALEQQSKTFNPIPTICQ